MKKISLMLIVLVLFMASCSISEYKEQLSENVLSEKVEFFGYVEEPEISINADTYAALIDNGLKLHVVSWDNGQYVIDVKSSDPIKILGKSEITRGPCQRYCQTCYRAYCNAYVCGVYAQYTCGCYPFRC